MGRAILVDSEYCDIITTISSTLKITDEQALCYLMELGLAMLFDDVIEEDIDFNELGDYADNRQARLNKLKDFITPQSDMRLLMRNLTKKKVVI
jgi:hypothetical protein